MNLTRITYLGRKTYREKISNNSWEPNDTKLVTAEAAKKLLRFAEFKPATQDERAQAPVEAAKPEGEQKPTDQELEAAMLRQQEDERAQAQERQQLEAMLLTVESMDKPALEEYARKYEVELDKRLGVAKLRAEVSNLIEQFGAR